MLEGRYHLGSLSDLLNFSYASYESGFTLALIYFGDCHIVAVFMLFKIWHIFPYFLFSCVLLNCILSVLYAFYINMFLKLFFLF